AQTGIPHLAIETFNRRVPAGVGVGARPVHQRFVPAGVADIALRASVHDGNHVADMPYPIAPIQRTERGLNIDVALGLRHHDSRSSILRISAARSARSPAGRTPDLVLPGCPRTPARLLSGSAGFSGWTSRASTSSATPVRPLIGHVLTSRNPTTTRC